MSSAYCQSLDKVAKRRYEDKLLYEGEQLPDPLDDDLRSHLFKHSIKSWPNLTFGDVYMYLVEKECVYTRERFKNYKGLECYNYFLSGKIQDILMYKNEALKICIATCKMEASQTLKKMYKPWSLMTEDGLVLCGHCTCMVGLGEVCSHVAALLLAIEAAVKEGINNPSCTSLPCLWNKTSKHPISSIPAVKFRINHKRKKTTSSVVQKKAYALSSPTNEAYENLLEAIKEHQPSAAIFTVLPDSDTDSASEGEENQSTDVLLTEVAESQELPDLLSLYNNFNESVPKHISVRDRMKILVKSVNLNQYTNSLIEKQTRGQQQNKNWLQQKKGRLTSSFFGRVLKVKTGHENLICSIMQYDAPLMTESMRWGCENEDSAKKQFVVIMEEHHVNFEVTKTGMKIDETFPFLGASPDGLVSCDCCDVALLEIKCPFRGKDKTIVDIASKDFFLDENLILKSTHPYYDQIQGQMGIWEIEKCFFIVYTNVDIHVQIIDFDVMYWNTQKSRLLAFFEKHVLPEICYGDIAKKISDARQSCICRSKKASSTIMCKKCGSVFHKICVNVKRHTLSWHCQKCVSL